MNRLELEQFWYKQQDIGILDYSVYNHPAYLEELEFCYKNYSKKYINLIKTKLLPILGKVERVVDLGCGKAETTKELKAIFPNAVVFGTNIEESNQIAIARETAKANGFFIETDLSKIKQVDLVFASEYFEHLEYPINNLREILALMPNYLIIANAFNSRATGHLYKYQGNIPNSKIGRLFNAELRKFGYNQMKLGFWNNRPNVWKYGK